MTLQKNFSNLVAEIFAKKISKKLPKKVAVAVSGGCDSVALTFLLSSFCAEKNIELVALTVDHKMRESSSKEALELGKILEKNQISHHTLEINNEKVPEKNIEAKLREMRYDLLNGFCEKNKIKHLFLGHHLGDVAENFLIRLFRGSGLDGLSTMREVVSCSLLVASKNNQQLTLIRPLLDFNKDELKAFLRERKIKWFEDETNDDERFLRNKIRKFFATFEEEDLIQKRVKNASDEISKMRDFFDAIVEEEAKKILKENADGSIVLKHKKLLKLDEKIALKILAESSRKVAGKDYKPRLEKLKKFYEYLKTDEIKPRGFYGCEVNKFDEEHIIISKQLTTNN